MKFLKPTALAACLLFTLLACDDGLDNVNKRDSNVAQVTLDEANKEPQQTETTDTTRQPPTPIQQFQSSLKTIEPKSDWNKKIIKTASINVEVKNYKAFNELTHQNIKRFGAYIAQEEQSQTDYKIENVVTIKVPVAQFDDLVASLTADDHKLLEKKISSEDITTQIVDTKSRMEAKKQVRSRYLDLLKQAKNMEEILSVQNEVNGIQEDIEAATGRIEYLTHSAVYSTINLTYFQILDESAKNAEELSFGTKLWQSFKNGWSWIGDIFIGLISIWPLFPIGFACWLAYKKWRSSKIQKPMA
jgi:hypothetical protein